MIFLTFLDTNTCLAQEMFAPIHRWLQWATIAGLGFCIYGPHMLIGLCGAELVDKPAVGASQVGSLFMCM